MVGKLFWLFVGSVVYTYFGYPVLLTLLARFRSKPRSFNRPAVAPLVTLLITAHNEEMVIAEKLENSLALNYPANRLQILVAADGSNDRTVDIVRSYRDRGVELSYSPPRRGKMAAINRAMSQVRGEIVIFSDANNHYNVNALMELTAPFSDRRVGAVSGAKSIVKGDGLLGESERLYWRYESFIKKQESKLGCCTGVTGEILAIRRDLFEFPPDGIINDDFYLAMRLVQQGYDVIYAPEARSIERISISAQDEIARRSRIIAGRYQAMALAHQLLPLRRPLIVWQILSHKFFRPLVPLAMLGALITNSMAIIWPRDEARFSIGRLGPPFNWVMLVLQTIFYGLAFASRYTERSSRFGKLLYLPTFLVNSNFAALIGLYRFATKGQSTTWQRIRRREALLPILITTAQVQVEPKEVVLNGGVLANEGQ
jgi:cellulose synthase/poly-beta-1,6-N-acetylglucosamine synthase-like glycosyltransferase